MLLSVQNLQKFFFNSKHHLHYFNPESTWSFFATSHGKSPCDGVGEMVKQKLTQASLKRPTNNQILSMEAVYEFCGSEMTSVNFLIEKNPLQSVREFLQRRYAMASTVPGMR